MPHYQKRKRKHQFSYNVQTNHFVLMSFSLFMKKAITSRPHYCTSKVYEAQ